MTEREQFEAWWKESGREHYDGPAKALAWAAWNARAGWQLPTQGGENGR